MPRSAVTLDLERAPPVAVPRRFFASVPAWGVVAGALLASDAGGAVASRRHPATLAATHAFALGDLGPAIFGGLMQFLPAAAGVRVRWIDRLGLPLHAALNLGIVLLVTGLRLAEPRALAGAAAVLAGAFALLAAMTLPGLLAAAKHRLLRAGIAAAVVAALTTATLGASIALALAGVVVPPAPLPRLVDAHAAWGIVGFVLLLTASVARVVMPMFQGASAPSRAALATWSAAVVAVLIAGSWRRVQGGDDTWLRNGAAGAALAFATAVAWLQLRTRAARNRPLRAFWRAGAIALAAAALALLAGDGLPAGALALGVALPLITIGMQLEIGVFLGWIELVRSARRGTPPLRALMPARDRVVVLVALLVAGTLTALAALRPGASLGALAATATMLAYAALGAVQLALRARIVRLRAAP